MKGATSKLEDAGRLSTDGRDDGCAKTYAVQPVTRTLWSRRSTLNSKILPRTLVCSTCSRERPSRVGGKAIAAEQLPELLKQIKATPPQDEIETQSKWQMGDTSLDAWSFFLLLVGLLTAEWFLRKRWGMV